MSDTQETINQANLTRGQNLRKRIVWTAVTANVPSDTVVASESQGIAERMAAIDKMLEDQLATLSAGVKDFRTYAEETLAQLNDPWRVWGATLVPDTNEAGEINQAIFESDDVTVIVRESAAIRRTIESMIQILGSAPDEDLLPESAKKGRRNNNPNATPRALADDNARKFGVGYTIKGGSKLREGDAKERTEGWSYNSFLLYDTTEEMRTTTKLIARCTRELDMGRDMSAGEIYGVLTGDLPARVDKATGEPTMWLRHSPQTIDIAIQGRAYLRIVVALKKKARELEDAAKKDKQLANAGAYNDLKSEVIDDSKKRTAAAKANAPTTKPAAPTSLEDMKRAITNYRAEWKTEQAKGPNANQTRLKTLASLCAAFHVDYPDKVKQFEDNKISAGEWDHQKNAMGRQVLESDEHVTKK